MLSCSACRPDLKPVELAFSEFGRLFRSAALRTVSVVRDIIGRPLDDFSLAECAAYLRHGGHAQPGR
jgi:hypothetical protein